MLTEWLNVVDDNDQIMGIDSRQRIHAAGLKHRAVHILLFNDDHSLFLQKRSMSKDINPGLWDSSAAGHVDAGETYEQCAYRELKEELGLIDCPLEFLFKIPAAEVTGKEFIEVYQGVANGPFILNVDEIETGAWFSHEEMSSRIKGDDMTLTGIIKMIWSRLLN
jgi:isopentenyl-diphosphate delta-isomerase type 1